MEIRYKEAHDLRPEDLEELFLSVGLICAMDDASPMFITSLWT